MLILVKSSIIQEALLYEIKLWLIKAYNRDLITEEEFDFFQKKQKNKFKHKGKC